MRTCFARYVFTVIREISAPEPFPVSQEPTLIETPYVGRGWARVFEPTTRRRAVVELSNDRFRRSTSEAQMLASLVRQPRPVDFLTMKLSRTLLAGLVCLSCG